MYARIIENMINTRGITILYYPVSEYNLQSISALWGEDTQKKYLEKYTLKALYDGTENDALTFNSFGLTKENAERTIFISKKQFREIVGREDPLQGDHYLWTQNNIIYEVTNFTDQQNIVMGDELWWTVTGTPRRIEGEVYGKGDCEAGTIGDDGKRAEPIDPLCEWGPSGKDALVNEDGNVTDNPDIFVPGPTPKKNDDNKIAEKEKVSTDYFIRDSWGGLG